MTFAAVVTERVTACHYGHVTTCRLGYGIIQLSFRFLLKIDKEKGRKTCCFFHLVHPPPVGGGKSDFPQWSMRIPTESAVEARRIAKWLVWTFTCAKTDDDDEDGDLNYKAAHSRNLDSTYATCPLALLLELKFDPPEGAVLCPKLARFGCRMSNTSSSSSSSSSSFVLIQSQNIEKTVLHSS